MELFSPLHEGLLVVQQTYLKHMAEYAKTEWGGVPMSEDQIKKIWQKIEKNQFLGDDVPDEFIELYERMAADRDLAIEMMAEKQEVKEAPKVSESITPPVSEESAESLALLSAVQEGVELSSFTSKFDLGAGMTQCVPRGEVSMKDWVKAFAFGLTLESGAQWIVGDAVVALEDAGHDNVVNQLCAQFKRSYPTVSGYARASRAFKHDARDGSLPFSVYREIGNASFGDETPKKQQLLLEQAKSEQLSSTEVRSRVRAEQGKGDAPAAHRFLILNLSNFDNSEVVREVPEELEENQLLIDLSGKSWFDPGNEEWRNFLKGE